MILGRPYLYDPICMIPGRPYLYDPSEVAVSSELEALFLCPDFDASEPSLPAVAPGPRTQTQARVQHQRVEQPHVDEVEQL